MSLWSIVFVFCVTVLVIVAARVCAAGAGSLFHATNVPVWGHPFCSIHVRLIFPCCGALLSSRMHVSGTWGGRGLMILVLSAFTLFRLWTNCDSVILRAPLGMSYLVRWGNTVTLYKTFSVVHQVVTSFYCYYLCRRKVLLSVICHQNF